MPALVKLDEEEDFVKLVPGLLSFGVVLSKPRNAPDVLRGSRFAYRWASTHARVVRRSESRYEFFHPRDRHGLAGDFLVRNRFLCPFFPGSLGGFVFHFDGLFFGLLLLLRWHRLGTSACMDSLRLRLS